MGNRERAYSRHPFETFRQISRRGTIFYFWNCVLLKRRRVGSALWYLCVVETKGWKKSSEGLPPRECAKNWREVRGPYADFILLYRKLVRRFSLIYWIVMRDFSYTPVAFFNCLNKFNLPKNTLPAYSRTSPIFCWNVNIFNPSDG